MFFNKNVGCGCGRQMPQMDQMQYMPQAKSMELKPKTLK